MNETTIIIIMSFCIIFLCLGFYMGRLSSNQAIPRLKSPIKKKPSKDLSTEFQEDPFNKAMREPPEKRIEKRIETV